MNVVIVSDARLSPVAGARAWTDNEPLEDGPWLTMAEVDDDAVLQLDGVVQAWHVEPTRQWDYERTWPAGEPSPGVKRVAFIQRAEGLDRAEFARHWRDVHGPLAKIHHPAIVRYCQNVIVEPLVDNVGDAGEFDGIAELSFWSMEDLNERMYDSEDGRRIVGEDVRRFINLPKGWRVITKEHVVVDRYHRPA
jgi:uncharacterized protein (TIGR02118 family)